MFLVAQAEQLFGDTEAAALPALLESGRLPARISGLPASARALLAASMHAQLDAPVLAVCPDEAAAELFQKDLSALLGQDMPLLTARDYTFYTVESVSRQTEQKRLSALYALAAGTAPAVVCTVSGLLQRAMPKEKLLQAAFEIRDGSSLPPEDAEDALLRCGYLRTAQVEGPGQFSRRGGILDFFSPAYPQPVRVEFWGDDVDSMGFFDPESQRRTQPLESCRILPAAETLPPLYPGGSAALGEKLQKLVVALAVVLSLGLTIGLFMILPTFLAGLLGRFIPNVVVHNLVESVIKLLIFFGYLLLCSKQKDIQRVFQYHGAEHKTIFCYEAGLPLTVENCRIQPRHHPRCGTSFLFVVVVVSILVSSVVFSFVDWRNVWVRIGLHLLLLVPVVGVTYEFNRYVGGHDNPVTNALAKPGLWLQNFTTNEPDDSMLEVAIRAMELVIPEQKGKHEW